MEDYKSTYPSDEMLKSSTTMTVENRTDIQVTFENWTCGFGFLIDSVNCLPHKTSEVKAEYVWYDFQAKDSDNKVLAKIRGVYYSHKVTFTKSIDGTYHLSSD
ncbi:hypothetical protein [Bacteroides sp.]